MKHISDWCNLNNVRKTPNLSLISERIKPQSHKKAVELWKNLSSLDVPCLLIEVTDVCNNKCEYCLSNSEHSENLCLNDLDNLIICLKEKGLTSVWITGGEPLHDFQRFKSICEKLISNNIDIEKISTSLIANSKIFDEFIELINFIGKNNDIFKCTISIGINSYLNIVSDHDSFETRIDYLITNTNKEITLIHIPTIIDDITSSRALKISQILIKKYLNISTSLKSKIPEKFDETHLKKFEIEEFSKYMDCASPSIFPCTWSMWHLKANGELYCCSSWFNDGNSKNYLGKIGTDKIEYEFSDFMKNVIAQKSWINSFQNYLSSISDTKSLLAPNFDDNTTKCYLCHDMMKNFNS